MEPNDHPSEANPVETGYYRPLVLVSYMFDYFLYGNSALGFHVTNLVLHALAVALLEPVR